MIDLAHAPRPGHGGKLEEDLDKALEQTFPASDPFSVGQATGTEPASRPVDRESPLVTPQLPARRRK